MIQAPIANIMMFGRDVYANKFLLKCHKFTCIAACSFVAA